jgi:alpha/beta superfamily hydrolase
MSRKIQERPVVFPSGDLVLEGLYHKGETAPGIVIGAPHPRYGGSMHSPVVAEVAYAAAREGRPTLRFNYRGVGGSQGTTGLTGTPSLADALESPAAPDDPIAELADFRAALQELRLTAGIGPMVAAGYSFGSALAVRMAKEDPDVVGLVLVAPPGSLFPAGELEGLRIPALVAAGEHDGHVDVARLRDAIQSSPAARLEIIPGADHFFDQGLITLQHVVGGFLGRL